GNTPADRLALFGHVNDPATAFPDLLEELVTPNYITGLFHDDANWVLRLVWQEFFANFISTEQGLDSRKQGRIAATSRFQKARTFFDGRKVQRLLKDFFLAIGIVRHDDAIFPLTNA